MHLIIFLTFAFNHFSFPQTNRNQKAFGLFCQFLKLEVRSYSVCVNYNNHWRVVQHRTALPQQIRIEPNRTHPTGSDRTGTWALTGGSSRSGRRRASGRAHRPSCCAPLGIRGTSAGWGRSPSTSRPAGTTLLSASASSPCASLSAPTAEYRLQDDTHTHRNSHTYVLIFVFTFRLIHIRISLRTHILTFIWQMRLSKATYSNGICFCEHVFIQLIVNTLVYQLCCELQHINDTYINRLSVWKYIALCESDTSFTAWTPQHLSSSSTNELEFN